MTINYAPPSFPPPDRVPLLPHTACPYNLDLELLSTRGWATLPLEPSDPLHTAFARLFRCSALFFTLPEHVKRKHDVEKRAGANPEEGYSHIPGEKSLMTLRKAASTHTELGLRDVGAEAWGASGAVVAGVIGAIEESLGMERGVLRRTLGEDVGMPAPGEGNVATLLRMFRYERPVPAGGDASGAGLQAASRVVAEAHKDLGLLTIVVGHTPGLECWDAAANEWAACEAGGRMSATLLAGQTLAKFTNWRYAAGRHRVFVHALPPPRPADARQAPPERGAAAHTDAKAEALLADPAYRFSLVHAVRAHLPVVVSSADFVTPITGTPPAALQYTDVRIAEIYAAISNAHWNVNIGVEERRKQEENLRQLALAHAAGTGTGKGEKMSVRRKRTSLARVMDFFRRASRYGMPAR